MWSPLTTPSPNLGKAAAPVSTPSYCAAWKLEQNTNSLFFIFLKYECYSQENEGEQKIYNKKNVLYPQKGIEFHFQR